MCGKTLEICRTGQLGREAVPCNQLLRFLVLSSSGNLNLSSSNLSGELTVAVDFLEEFSGTKFWLLWIGPLLGINLSDEKRDSLCSFLGSQIVGNIRGTGHWEASHVDPAGVELVVVGLGQQAGEFGCVVFLDAESVNF